MRRKAKRIWAFLLVLLLLFSVAGGSSFPVLAETEGAKSVSVEGEEAKEIEKAEKQAGGGERDRESRKTGQAGGRTAGRYGAGGTGTDGSR